MNYALAKKLKDAGFPQKYLNIFDDACKHPNHDLAHIGNCCGLYAPTLSEIIEACGTKFDKLEMRIGGWLALGIVADVVLSKKGIFFAQGGGMTPEEAVASLWLVLNDK